MIISKISRMFLAGALALAACFPATVNAAEAATYIWKDSETPFDFEAVSNSANAGVAEAQYQLYLYYGLAEGDEENSLKWLIKAADSGHADAQNILAMRYAQGRGVEESIQNALNYWLMAAENGHPGAQFWAATYLSTGIEGVLEADFPLSVELMQASAENGWAQAQGRIAYYYYTGLFSQGEADYANAVKWWQKAAEQGEMLSQLWLARCIYKGEGVASDKKKAVEMLSNLSADGYADAELALAECYRDDGAAGTMEKSLEHLNRAIRDEAENASQVFWSSPGIDKAKVLAKVEALAEAGNVMASRALTELYFNDSTISNGREKAVKCMERLALSGYEQECSYLALGYLSGRLNLEVDLGKARVWMRRLAEMPVGENDEKKIPARKLALAQHYMGMFSKEDGNYKEALEWFSKSADYGYSFAQYELGCLYLTGKETFGIPADKKKAAELFRLAAEQGHASSQLFWGQCLWLGVGVPANKVAAKKWLQKAAEYGEAEAQYSLGLLFLQRGGGGVTDRDEAKKWLEKASAQGHEDAMEALKKEFQN